MSVRVFPVGSSIDGIKDRPRTLAQLEADLRRVRTEGAPDTATVTTTGGPKSGSIYLAEIIWVEPSSVGPSS